MGRSCRSVAIALLAQAAVIASFVVLVVNLVQLGYLSERYDELCVHAQHPFAVAAGRHGTHRPH